MKPDALSARINKLPKWARDFIHNIETFIGAEEVQELTFLRDQNKALVKLVGELKSENRRLRKRLERMTKRLSRRTRAKGNRIHRVVEPVGVQGPRSKTSKE